MLVESRQSPQHSPPSSSNWHGDYDPSLERGASADKSTTSLNKKKYIPATLERALQGTWSHSLSDVGTLGRHEFARSESEGLYTTADSLGTATVESKESKGKCRFPWVERALSSSEQNNQLLVFTPPPWQQIVDRRSKCIAPKKGYNMKKMTFLSPYLSTVTQPMSMSVRDAHQLSQAALKRKSKHSLECDVTKPASSNNFRASSQSDSHTRAASRLTSGKMRNQSPSRRISAAAEWEMQNEIRKEQAQEKHESLQWLLAREGERGNAWKVLELLQAGIEASSVDEAGRTPCHFAAMNNHQQSVLALCFVDQVAYLPHDFEQQAKDGGSALHYAAFNGCFEAVDTLIQQHRRKIQKDRTDILSRHKESLKETQHALRNRKSQHRELEQNREVVLQERIRLTQEIVSFKVATIDDKASFNQKRKEMHQRQDELEKMLDMQAEACNSLEQAVAHWKPISRAKHEAFKASLSAAMKDLTSAQQVLEEHVRNTKDAEKGHAKAMRKYARGVLKSETSLQQLERDLPDVDEEVASSQQALDGLRRKRLAIKDEIKEYSRKVVVFPSSEFHIQFNDVVHCRGADGSTPLHWAAESGQDGITKSLIEQGGDVNAKDDAGMTPLHWAACASADPRLIPDPKPKRRHVEVGVVLLSAGADANAGDHLGCTPLHFAASKGFTRFVRMLKEWGGDSKKVSVHGQLPAHFAIGGGHLQCAEALLHAEKDILSTIHLADKNGLSPLQLATLNGHGKVLEAWLERF